MSHTQESEAGCAEKMLKMFSALIFELMADISDPLEEELRPDRSIFSLLLPGLVELDDVLHHPSLVNDHGDDHRHRVGDGPLPVVDGVLGHPGVPLPQPEHDVREAAVALPRPLELEHGVHDVVVALEQAGDLPPDVGGAEDEAAVVREDGGWTATWGPGRQSEGTHGPCQDQSL